MNQRIRRLFSYLLAFVLIMTPFSTVFADGTKSFEVERIAGANRYETSYVLSRELSDREDFYLDETSKAQNIILASGTSFPDALIAGAMAGQIGGVLELVNPNEPVHPWRLSTLYLISDEDTNFILMGGENTLPKSTENSFSGIHDNSVIRLAGANRYETAKVANQWMNETYNKSLLNPDGTYAVNTYKASGASFPDALSGSPLVAQNKGNFLLAPNGVNAGNQFIALGGENSIQGNPIQRFSGANRYATSVSIAKAMKETDTALLVDGTNYPDALAAGAFGGYYGYPVLLTNPESLPTEVKDYLIESSIENIIIVGGNNSVSKDYNRVVAS